VEKRKSKTKALAGYPPEAVPVSAPSEPPPEDSVQEPGDDRNNCGQEWGMEMQKN